MANLDSNPNIKKKYTLLKPLEEGSEKVTELTFTEPTLGTLKKADGIQGEMEKTAKLIELCCNIRPRLVDMIAPYDIGPIGEIIGSFFQKPQAT
jgi:Phage tail assembly chaperone proteins, E, or 41 or 14